LNVGAKRISARLFDESVGGFGVLADERPETTVGQKIELGIDRGWFRVRVIYIEAVDRMATVPDATTGASAATDAGSTLYRIGLRCLAEIPAPPEPSAVGGHRWSFFSSILHGSLTARLMVLTSLLAAVLLMSRG
jgi:hypothetical protein